MDKPFSCVLPQICHTYCVRVSRIFYSSLCQRRKFLSRKENYECKRQIYYFSGSYLKFEEDFYRYTAPGEMLTTLADDIQQ